MATFQVEGALALPSESAVTPRCLRPAAAAAALSALPSFLLHLRVTAGSGPGRGLLGFPRKEAASCPPPRKRCVSHSLNSWGGRRAGHQRGQTSGRADTTRHPGARAGPPARAPRGRGPAGSPTPEPGRIAGQRRLRLGLRFQFRNVTVQT